jgi:hypothetical protein
MTHKQTNRKEKEEEKTVARGELLSHRHKIIVGVFKVDDKGMCRISSCGHANSVSGLNVKEDYFMRPFSLLALVMVISSRSTLCPFINH